MQVSDNSPPRGSVRVRVRTPRRGSVRVRTPSRGGRLTAGGTFGRRGLSPGKVVSRVVISSNPYAHSAESYSISQLNSVCLVNVEMACHIV